ncbi:MAG TPA: DASS family sodium-coupled anion symporter [Vicinamibacterales bacterium]|nr:DASS family sodium-coupled anion symporter [Vicinamibacterales bacterium]
MTDIANRPHEAAGAPAEAYGFRQRCGWVIGPAALLLTLIVAPPEGLSDAGWRTAGAAALMAVFWIAEPIPIPATALLPLVLFPALGLGDIRETAAPFANPIVFLFLGGFIIALAMQRWRLHRRVAIALIAALGTRPPAIVAGFLLSSALISMWVSNTATALMMLPIAMSVVGLFPEDTRPSPPQRAFGTALLLAVAYGATTGGMGTLIGTPPNALLAAYVQDIYGWSIGFGQWMLLGVPIVLIALPIVYVVLTRVMFRLDSRELPGMADLIRAERGSMGPLGRAELAVAIVFALTAAGWVFQPLIATAVPLVSDTTIAMTGALLLFMIPVDLGRGQFVMDWQATREVPWGVLLLFGGGLSLAGNIERHGLAAYLGTLAGGLDGLPVLLVLGIVCFGILLLTELTSNTATAATFLPIAGALALSLGQNPLFFLVPAALAANCSYMMPVGTPPNAIVYGSGLISLPQMARAGLLLNVALVPVVLAALLFLGPWIFGLEIDVIPDWAIRAPTIPTG